MPVDQQTQWVIDQLRTRLPVIGSVTAGQLREIQAQMAAVAPKGPELAGVEDAVVETPAGSLQARIYTPHGQPVAMILYLHGGGWTIGSVSSSDHTVRKLAETTSCRVVSVDYRLAPEHPFPAAVEDAVLALRWAGERARQDEIPLILAGDSAGANLCAVASIDARDRNGPAIAAQILIYPSVRGDIEAPALKEFDAPFLTHADIAWFFDQYVPDRAARGDPRFAPMETKDLSGLPPTFILTAENDLLRREAEEYGLRLAGAGVPVSMRRYLGTVHGFFNFVGLQQWHDAHSDIASFTRGVLKL